MSIFDKRLSVKPYEYPEVLEYMKAIRGTMWFIDEFKERLDRDVIDYNKNLTPQEKSVIKKSLLAISQIEVAVKASWCNTSL